MKHRVEIDESVISDIRKEVAPAPWLRHKRERRVSDLPGHLDVADTDKVGRLYNVLRKEIGFLPDETGNGFEEKMSIEDFRGLFSGENVTREMFEECQLVNSIYGDIASQIVQREDMVKQQLKDAQAQWEAVRGSEDKERRKSAVLARNGAQAALWEHEQDARDQFSSLHLFVHYWAQGKQENRKAWAQAMNAVVTAGSGFRRGPLPVVSAGGGRCFCGNNRRPAGSGAVAKDRKRIRHGLTMKSGRSWSSGWRILKARNAKREYFSFSTTASGR